jgi:hypothetical protein
MSDQRKKVFQAILGLGLISIVCFWMPWIKISDSVRDLSYLLGVNLSGGASGAKVVSMIGDAFSMIGYYESKYKTYEYLIKIYYLIPILPAIALIIQFSSDNKKRVKTILFTSAIINIFLLIMPILVLASDEKAFEVSDLLLSFSYGYWGILIASGVSIYLINTHKESSLQMSSQPNSAIEADISHTQDTEKADSFNNTSSNQPEIDEKLKDTLGTTTRVSKEFAQKFTEDLSRRDFFEKFLLAIGIVYGIIAVLQVSENGFEHGVIGFLACAIIVFSYFKVSFRISSETHESLYSLQSNVNLLFENKVPKGLSSNTVVYSYVLAVLSLLRYFNDSYELLGQIVIFMSIAALPLFFLNCVIAFVKQQNQAIWKPMIILLAGYMYKLINYGFLDNYTYFDIYLSVNVLVYWVLAYWSYQHEQFFTSISKESKSKAV